ncbi:MAG: hypothetical protein NZM25_00775 [Leptospiraceae bacterium]|nr:hypothetical protein [Leptospiraceae bacterium]MDW8306259.1 hypothetical protein [Leptospiraceae bacterium]
MKWVIPLLLLFSCQHLETKLKEETLGTKNDRRFVWLSEPFSLCPREFRVELQRRSEYLLVEALTPECVLLAQFEISHRELFWKELFLLSRESTHLLGKSPLSSSDTGWGKKFSFHVQDQRAELYLAFPTLSRYLKDLF